MYSEENFIQISALQHYIFCPRQCGLIHIDEVWQDNLFTVRGDILHEKVDTESDETRGDLKIVRGLRIHSYKYGLVGKCDVVEFNENKKIVFPIEYKAGEPKEDISDKVQLCAQALCLEEMLNTQIKKGGFYYGKIRRRIVVDLENDLRDQTLMIIQKVRSIIESKKVPIEEYSKKCRNCSLINICQPKALYKSKVQKYISELFET